MSDKIESVTVEEFDRRWRSTYNRVFSGRDLDKSPFQSPEWRSVCIGAPAYYFSADQDNLQKTEREHCQVYEALLIAIDEAGDSELIEFLRNGPHRNLSIFLGSSLSLPVLREMHVRPLDGFDRHIFGPSGSWGLTISWDEEIAVVGGTPQFFEKFSEQAGGEDVLRADFLRISSYLNELSDEWRAIVARLLHQSGWRSAQ